MVLVTSWYCGGQARKVYNSVEEAVFALKAMGARYDFTEQHWVLTNADVYGNEAYFEITQLS